MSIFMVVLSWLSDKPFNEEFLLNSCLVVVLVAAMVTAAAYKADKH